MQILATHVAAIFILLRFLQAVFELLVLIETISFIKSRMRKNHHRPGIYATEQSC